MEEPPERGSKRAREEAAEQALQRAGELEKERAEAVSGVEARAIEELLKGCREEGLKKGLEEKRWMQVGRRPYEEMEGEPQDSQHDGRKSVVLGKPGGRDNVVSVEEKATLEPPADIAFLTREQDSQCAGRTLKESQSSLGDTASNTYASPQVSGSRWMVLNASNRQAFEQCRYNHATACQKKGLRFEDIGEPLLEALKVQEKAYARCSESKGDLFPLPLPSSLKPSTPSGFCIDALVQALNSLYGTKTIVRVREDKTRLNLIKRLEKVVEESELRGAEVPDIDFGEFFQARSVDYSGEIVQVARRFDWRMVEAAFPEAVGSLELEEFCDGGTLAYVKNFEEFLLPPQDQHLGKAPSIMVEASHWAEVCSGLIRRGVCRLMHRSELHHIGGRPLLNGLFAVSKQEQATDAHGNLFEVCRLIMNLVPTNACCRSLVGDTSTLPSVVGMSSIILEDNQLLVTSSEDIRCFFYLFRTPPSWWKYMGFGREVPSEALPGGYAGTGWHLVTQVLPMGFINSVAIAQHVHRRVINQALKGESRLASGHQEIRRDRPASSAPHLFRVYLDNYDELKKVDRTLADMLAGTPSAWTLAVRQTYETLGLPRHPKKAVTQAVKAEVQGAWVDGEVGKAGPKPEKVMRYVKLACEAVIHGRASQRELQVIGGGFVYIAMFRRPLLAGLNALWRRVVELDKLRPSQRAPLGAEVEHELLRFVALTPLAFMDFRTPVSEKVTASDASTTGGGLCVSRSLSPYGVAASLASCRGDVISQDEVNPILVVSLFDGIGALRVAVDSLQVPVAGYVSAEISPEARRVVESWFPEVIAIEDVQDIGENEVSSWCLRFPGVCAVLLGAGPPCQGVSGLNADRRGALRDVRSCLFSHVPRVEALLKRFFTWCPTFTLVENVASMDPADCQVMSRAYGMDPWLVDAGGLSLCRRPRLYWFNWEPRRLVGATIDTQAVHRLPVAGAYELKATVDERDFLEPGWQRTSPVSLPTFTTSRPSPTPGRKPAGLALCPPDAVARWHAHLHRFPPYQYRWENSLTNSKGEVRVPSIAEREAILGFPSQYTAKCLPKAETGSERGNDIRLTLLGNSWSVPVVACLLHCLFATLGLNELKTVQELVDQLTPGKCATMAGLLMRPPLRHTTQPGQECHGLVRKLLGQISVKGEDILLQLSTDIPARYHRLRASIPGKLWRWRDVVGWRWTGEAEHINALELRAVKTALVWRIKELQESGSKCLHLVDSLVVLHALSRGRSSSRKLRRTLAKISALLLASGLHVAWGYIDTKQNPADKPSRRPIRKGWLKARRR